MKTINDSTMVKFYADMAARNAAQAERYAQAQKECASWAAMGETGTVQAERYAAKAERYADLVRGFAGLAKDDAAQAERFAAKEEEK